MKIKETYIVKQAVKNGPDTYYQTIKVFQTEDDKYFLDKGNNFLKEITLEEFETLQKNWDKKAN